MTPEMMFPIADVSGLEMAFGGDINALMPKYADIPDEFKRGHGKWNDLVSAWFYGGLSELKLTPKAGVDEAKALRHVRAILVSFEPKHEHKEAGCAYLLSQWFSDATWKMKRRDEASGNAG